MLRDYDEDRGYRSYGILPASIRLPSYEPPPVISYIDRREEQRRFDDLAYGTIAPFPGGFANPCTPMPDPFAPPGF